MANKQVPSFFILPTELRLEVYNHLLTSTLADGAASDIAGLYMSCKTTQSEMQTLVANVQPIFNIKHAWDIDSQAEGTLHFEAPPNHTYLAPPTELRVLVPINSKPTNWSHLASLLTPIFHLPLETLRLAVSGAASKDDLGRVEHASFLHFALKWQNGGRSKDRPKFEQINRIILQHEAPKTTLPGMVIWRDYLIGSLGLMTLDAGEALADVKVIWYSQEVGRAEAKLGLGFQDTPPAPEGEVFHVRTYTGEGESFTSWTANSGAT
jgi:hypothetical protein